MSNRRTIRLPAQVGDALLWAQNAIYRGLESGKPVVLTVTRLTRTLDQNSKIHAMIGEIAEQADHRGQKFSADDWKIILVHAFGKELRLLPALDGSLIGVSAKTSAFTVAEGSDFIEWLNAWAAEKGVRFAAPERWE